jgi:hypothetical protein
MQYADATYIRAPRLRKRGADAHVKRGPARAPAMPQWITQLVSAEIIENDTSTQPPTLLCDRVGCAVFRRRVRPFRAERRRLRHEKTVRQLNRKTARNRSQNAP